MLPSQDESIQHSYHRERYYSIEHKSDIRKPWCKIIEHTRLPNKADKQNHA